MFFLFIISTALIQMKVNGMCLLAHDLWMALKCLICPCLLQGLYWAKTQMSILHWCGWLNQSTSKIISSQFVWTPTMSDPSPLEHAAGWQAGRRKTWMEVIFLLLFVTSVKSVWLKRLLVYYWVLLLFYRQWKSYFRSARARNPGGELWDCVWFRKYLHLYHGPSFGKMIFFLHKVIFLRLQYLTKCKSYVCGFFLFVGTSGQPFALQIRFILVPGGCCNNEWK